MTHLLRLSLRAAALCGLAAGGAVAGPAFSPYDMTYHPRAAAVPVYADMTEKAARKGEIPAGAHGVVLRWCRMEIPFGSWQFGSDRDRLKLLDERWCEVSYEGRVGNVEGRLLAPD